MFLTWYCFLNQPVARHALSFHIGCVVSRRGRPVRRLRSVCSLQSSNSLRLWVSAQGQADGRRLPPPRLLYPQGESTSDRPQRLSVSGGGRRPRPQHFDRQPAWKISCCTVGKKKLKKIEKKLIEKSICTSRHVNAHGEATRSASWMQDSRPLLISYLLAYLFFFVRHERACVCVCGHTPRGNTCYLGEPHVIVYLFCSRASGCACQRQTRMLSAPC